MVILRIKNIDLKVDGNFTFTKQSADVGDVSKSNANFTNSFKVINDDNSRRAFDGLGITGDVSRAPYVRQEMEIIVNGISIVLDGWLLIQSVDESHFNVALISGNIDFWEEIKGVVLSDLDLSEIEHAKLMQNVLNSFDNPYYKYVIADYGGQTNPYNIDYLVPSISEAYIFRQLMSYLGFSYSLDVDIETWLAIGKDSEVDREKEEILRLEIDDYNAEFPFTDGRFQIVFNQTSNGATYDENTSEITIPFSSSYVINAQYQEMIAEYAIQKIGEPLQIVWLPINHFYTVNGYKKQFGTEEYIREDDEIFLRFQPLSTGDLHVHGWEGYEVVNVYRIRISDYLMVMETYEVDVFDFGNPLSKIKAIDWLKELMQTYALAVFTDGQHVDFMSFDKRASEEVQMDLTPFVVERKQESFTLDNYERKNIYHHKYDEEPEDFNDGILFVNNQNLLKEQIYYEGVFYSPDQQERMKMWDKEVNEKDDEIEIIYKPMKDRVFRLQLKIGGSALLYSKKQDIPPTPATNIPILDFKKSGFRYWIKTNYKQFEEKILDLVRVEVFSLDISLPIFMEINLRKLIHIDNKEYLINRVKYDSKNNSEIEVIRLTEWQNKLT